MIIFENVCEINNYKYEHICAYMLIYLDVKIEVIYVFMFRNVKQFYSQ